MKYTLLILTNVIIKGYCTKFGGVTLSVTNIKSVQV